MSDEISITQLKDIIQKQQDQIISLEKRVDMALKQAEAAEQYTRQDCLILRGRINIRPDMNLRDEVMRIIAHHTGVEFPSWCLNTVHWLGKKDSLIVRFNNKSVREAIYRNRVPRDQSKRGLFIHESLTSTKMRVVTRCAKLRSDGHISTYYTQGGNVYIKRARDTPGLLIDGDLSEQDIMSLVTTQPASYRDATVKATQSHAMTDPPQHQPDRPQSDNNGTTTSQQGQAPSGMAQSMQNRSRSVEHAVAEQSQTKDSTQGQTGLESDQVRGGTVAEAVTKSNRVSASDNKDNDPVPTSSISGQKRQERERLARKDRSSSCSGSDTEDGSDNSQSRVADHDVNRKSEVKVPRDDQIHDQKNVSKRSPHRAQRVSGRRKK